MTEENHAGWIKGGASIEYKPTMTQEKDDLGHIVKEILTDEEATFKSGLFTWNGQTLAKFAATAEITTETRDGNLLVFLVDFLHIFNQRPALVVGLAGKFRVNHCRAVRRECDRKSCAVSADHKQIACFTWQSLRATLRKTLQTF